MKRREFLYGSAALLGAAQLGLTGCSSGSNDTEKKSKAVVIAWKIDDISSLDPAIAFEKVSSEVCRNIYNTLVVYKMEDTTQFEGLAAESWEDAGDGKNYTFHIRKGMTFHSGRPVTAHDFVYSIERALGLGRAPIIIPAGLGFTKENVRECVKAVDDYTIGISLPEERALTFVLACFTTCVMAVVDSEEVKAHEMDGDWGSEWLRKNSAGSGPFKLRNWVANESVAFERYDGYWRGPAAAEIILLRHLPEPSTQQLLLERGDIHVARNLNTTQINRFTDDPNFDVVAAPSFRLVYMNLNTKYEPFQNSKVLKALKYLIDYEGINNTILKGFADIHQTLVPQGIWASLRENPYTFDPERAKTLLAEAGYPDGFEVALDVRGSSPDLEMAQTVQASFALAGVKMVINTADYKQMLTKYKSRRHQIVLANWGADYPDPQAMALPFAGNPDNSNAATLKTVAWRASWQDEELTARILAGAKEVDSAKRKALYEDVQREQADKGPVIQMFQLRQVIVVPKGFRGPLLSPSSRCDTYLNMGKKV